MTRRFVSSHAVVHNTFNATWFLAPRSAFSESEASQNWRETTAA